MLQKGIVDISTVWRAYVSNLQLVMNSVKKLLPSLIGKTCVTSDHGESFGRFGIFYGHPAKIAIPELIEVPWLEVQSDILKNGEVLSRRAVFREMPSRIV